jgi:5'-3' exonuclease
MKGIGKVKAEKLIKKYGNPELSVPEQAKNIYEKEGFSLDQYYSCLNTVTIWRKPLPEALLDNELITDIVKTIPTLK